MRGLSILFIALLGTTIAAGQDRPSVPMSPQQSQDHVISGQEIRDWGLIRMSDILGLSAGFSGWSVDGFRLDGLVLGAGPSGSQEWRIAVDGQEVDARFLDGFHSEALPVSPSSIRQVRLRPPGSGPGGLSSAGWILFETLAPDSLGATATFSAGNEVGDPGPYRYTDLATPNVDRDGPSADLELSIPVAAGRGGQSFFRPQNGGPLRFSAGIRADQAHLTNEAIQDRVYVLYDGARKPRMTLIQPRLGVDLNAAGGQHRLTWTRTTLRDLPFLEAMGSELPVRRNSSSLRASGRQRVAGMAWTYGISASRSRMPERANGEDLSLDWAESLLRVRLELGPDRLDASWSIGTSLLKRQPETDRFEPVLPAVPQFDIKVARSLASGWKQVWSGQLIIGRYPRTRLLPGVFLDLVRTEGPWTWSARAGFVNETPEESGVETLWLAGGWDYPGDGAGRSRAPDSTHDTRTGSMDLQARRTQGDFEVAVTVYGRTVQGLNVATGRLEPDSLFQARYLSERSFVSGADGALIGVRVQASQSFGDHLSHRLDYGIAGPVSADKAFREAVSGLSAVHVRYSLRASPYPRTFFGLVARFDSRTEWPRYYTASGGSRVVRLPARVTVDATFSKRLAGNHLRLHVTLRNLTRGLTSSHPAGPLRDLLFVVGLRASF